MGLEGERERGRDELRRQREPDGSCLLNSLSAVLQLHLTCVHLTAHSIMASDLQKIMPFWGEEEQKIGVERGWFGTMTALGAFY